ncbi:hypothetical protein [uncultured Parabacteroides sp.]|uniref:hypothetical protein n=1 Tax=uncultured Parabacteroides sp. TaxID=512312 RepID=UPI002619B3BD|nr:hypothetical protein [uncultured Parabacteroides sp.]
MAPIPILDSIKAIEKLYDTGERPVLVACSDKNWYICKYMRSSTRAFKLASELIGAQFASVWKINSPKYAFVKIKQEHWGHVLTPRSLSGPALGYYFLEGVADITPSTSRYVTQKKRYAEIFHHLIQKYTSDSIWKLAEELKPHYNHCVNESGMLTDQIVDSIPQEWNIHKDVITEKLQQLFQREWVENVWSNFLICVNDNISHE